MEKTNGLIQLNETELKEINGGAFPLLIIMAFVPTPAGIMNFIRGLTEGYKQTTQ
jgi:lactobin A/cerein 7B family class IIb bacteriocin